MTKKCKTKAEVLSYLKNISKNDFYIENIVFFNVIEWEKNRKKILNQIINKFQNKKIIVRSSTSVEDNNNESNAGKFMSILNVEATIDSLEKTVNEVIDSYKNLPKDKFDSSQVIIQTMTKNLKLSGVVFSKDNITGLPYYLINYDNSEITDSITSGNKNGIREYIYYSEADNTSWCKLIKIVEKIKSILNYSEVDIEFAINIDNQIIIFQARPLIISKNKSKNGIKNFLSQYEKYKSNILSDMAFWNPSEIIGSNPNSLSLTLYEELITDSVWNRGIIKLGYKKLNKKLMITLLNKPYILIDVSFDALIPKIIKGKLREQLLNIYKLEIKKKRYLHDKIEFDLVDTCFSFNINKKIINYYNKYKLSVSDCNRLVKLLKIHLEKCITKSNKQINSSILLIRKMIFNRKRILYKLKYNNESVTIKDISILIRDTKKYGTKPFTYIARLAFMTENILRSAFNYNEKNKNEFIKLKAKIITVTTVYNKLYKEDKDLFNILFAHLRPGTYDIYQSAYGDLKNIYDDYKKEEKIFLFDKIEIDKKLISCLQNKFDTERIDINAKKFIELFVVCLQRREYYKYCFTKNLSLILELIKIYGKKNDIKYNELGDINIKKLINKKFSKDMLSPLINEKIIYPETIISQYDILNVKFERAKPNYVTDEIIKGKLYKINDKKKYIPDDSIVIIEKADPGYDWIFSFKIKALITKHGGSASHMTIRCNELKIPAAIGCGELIYSKLLNKESVMIDCYNQKII